VNDQNHLTRIDVYLKGELIDVDESPDQGQAFSVKRHVEPPKVVEKVQVKEEKKVQKGSEGEAALTKLEQR
jgi:hypothetical protein